MPQAQWAYILYQCHTYVGTRIDAIRSRAGVTVAITLNNPGEVSRLSSWLVFSPGAARRGREKLQLMGNRSYEDIIGS
jgi:hypothetical protein